MAIRRLKKWMQRLLIDSVLFCPPPFIILVIVTFGIVLLLGYWCAHLVDHIDITSYQHYNKMYDNIGGLPPKTWIEDIFPVDVVYTWVNGSDPLLLHNLEVYGSLRESHNSNCPFTNCHKSKYYSVEHKNDGYEILEAVRGIRTIKKLERKDKDYPAALVFSVQSNYNSTFVQQEVNIKLNTSSSVLYWTSDDKNEAIPWYHSIIFKCKKDNVDEFLKEMMKRHYNNLKKSCSIYSYEGSCVAECNNKYFKNLLVGKLNSTRLEFWPVFLNNFKSATKENNVNRYMDNEELKYSLRSLEKYMPWVRKIFLVTNGQIPHWLNLAHQRLKIVTHEEIFVNKEFLPTFSSNAIEANIHRISGLSEHFVYFNDDFFLRAEIFPEDFYSPSSGYKVYLSWHLPECSSGCPNSWLNDGYCDAACNTTECSFDGGDCIGENIEDYEDAKSPSDTCSPLCIDSWIADSFCDEVCNISRCGFDGGDCGMSNIHKNVTQLLLPQINGTVVVPEGIYSLWFNFTSLNMKKTEMKGSFSKHKGIRTMAISASTQTLIMLLRKNFSDVSLVKLSTNSDETFTFYLKYNTKMDIGEEMARRNKKEKAKLLQLDNSEEKYASLNQKNKKFSLGKHNITLKTNLTSKLTNFTLRKLVSIEGISWQRKEDSFEIVHDSFSGRKLLDAFAESMKYVNRLYNKEYGYKIRKVPAHVPYFINKTVLEELQERFEEDFYRTSSHKFRSADDMQFAFAYYHYLTSEKYHRTKEEIFHFIDTDSSGTWADREIRTFMAMSEDLPVYFSEIILINEELRNCSKFDALHGNILSTPAFERYSDSNLPTVSLNLVEMCTNTSLENRLINMSVVSKYKHNFVKDKSWHFKMLTSNVSNVIKLLDEVRKDRRKFNCINNDLDPDGQDNDIIRALLSDFFESVLPIPSSFELSANYRNKYLYVSHLDEWKARRRLIRAVTIALVTYLIFLTIYIMYGPKIEKWKNQICKYKRKSRHRSV